MVTFNDPEARVRELFHHFVHIAKHLLEIVAQEGAKVLVLVQIPAPVTQESAAEDSAAEHSSKSVVVHFVITRSR